MDNLEIILKNTYSLNQLKSRIRVLKEYVKTKIYTTKNPEGEVDRKDLEWIKTLPANFLEQFNQNNMARLFQNLESQITQLPSLTIFLPIEAETDVLSQIGSFVKNNFTSFKLIDTKYDPNLIAGCGISWKGVYRDYSLRARIEEKKSEILQEFKKYLR